LLPKPIAMTPAPTKAMPSTNNKQT
jgi:hypothetical protein